MVAPPVALPAPDAALGMVAVVEGAGMPEVNGTAEADVAPGKAAEATVAVGFVSGGAAVLLGLSTL